MFELNPETVSAGAGALLSLIFSYTPGVAPKYNALDATTKRLVMLALLLIVTGLAFGLGCAGAVQGVSCASKDIWQSIYLAARVFVAALIANQSTDRISPSIGAKA